MGRLINPGVGELSDRLSILALKLLVGGESGTDVSHFQKEADAILVQLRTRELNGKWFEAYTKLAAVNACLWHAEDQLRAIRTGPAGYLNQEQSTAALAFRIQALNDQRAACIAAINKETGDLLGTEKLSSPSDQGGGSKGNRDV